MLDLKFVRENPEVVKQNIRNKFQDSKLELVDEVIKLSEESRDCKSEADGLRADRNTISKQIGTLMAQGKKEEAEEAKKKVTANSARLAELEVKEAELEDDMADELYECAMLSAELDRRMDELKKQIYSMEA